MRIKYLKTQPKYLGCLMNILYGSIVISEQYNIIITFFLQPDSRRLVYNSDSPFWLIACLFFNFLKRFDSCVTFNLSYIIILYTHLSYISYSIIRSIVILCGSSAVGVPLIICNVTCKNKVDEFTAFKCIKLWDLVHFPLSMTLCSFSGCPQGMSNCFQTSCSNRIHDCRYVFLLQF